jgi:hypothetical protein
MFSILAKERHSHSQISPAYINIMLSAEDGGIAVPKKSSGIIHGDMIY